MTPVVSRLHLRSATVTWAAPAPPNGIITNYTVCLCPSLERSNNTAPNSSAFQNSSLWSDEVGKRPNSYHDLRPHVTRPDLRQKPTSDINTDSDDNSSSVLHPPSSVTKDWQSKSPLGVERNESNVLTLMNPNSTSHNSKPPLSTSPEAFLAKQHRLRSGCFSSASDPSSLSRSVTVSGNSTSSTFLDLRPYQIYISQVRTD